MLRDEILVLGETTRALQGPEGHEGLEQALADAAGSIPAPKVEISRVGRIQRGEGTRGDLKGRNLRRQSQAHRGHSKGRADPKGRTISQSHDSDASRAVG